MGTDVQTEDGAQAGHDIGRRRVLRGSTAAALGISTMALPTAAQAFSLTISGAPVAGVTVYWVERGSPGSANGRVGRLTYNGDTTVSNVNNAWITGVEAPTYLTTDGTHLYYSTPTTGASQGIWRVDITGTRTLILPGVVATRPFIDGTDLYYAAGSTIFRIAKDGSGSATTLYSGGSGDYRGIWVDGETLYFTDWSNGKVLTIPKAGVGGGSPTEFASVPQANAIAISGEGVYVGSEGDRLIYRFRTDGTSLGTFGAYGYIENIQIVDSVVFVGASNSTGIQASGPDGVNRVTFVFQGQTPQTIVGTNMHGMAILP